MDHPATRPSKKPLGFPVSAEALHALCHPDERHTYHRPVILPSGDLACSNGWLALKAQKFALPAPRAASPTFLSRWDSGPKWGPRGLWTATSAPWRPLDDVAGTLFRFGPRPVWEKGMLRWHLRVSPAVLVGAAAVVPLALLQLAARLPRAEILTETHRDAPARVRFNGGKMVIANHAQALLGSQKFSIFAPKSQPFP